MIQRVDTQTLESIHRLNVGSKEWLKVLEMLKKERDLITTKLVLCDDTEIVIRYQGMLRILTSLLSILNSASETLKKRKHK